MAVHGGGVNGGKGEGSEEVLGLKGGFRGRDFGRHVAPKGLLTCFYKGFRWGISRQGPMGGK